MTHTTKDPFWTDEAGTKIPLNRIRPYERKREQKIARLHKEATNLSNKIAQFKERMREECKAMYDEFLEEHGANPGKGNIDLYNFDRSIKLGVSVNDLIGFDTLTLEAAKSHFDEFMAEEVQTKTSVVKDMLLDAFASRNGMFDRKKVLNVLSYRNRVDDPRFIKGCDLISESIRKKGTKTYYRVWQRTGKDGEYELIDMNFSSL